MDKVKNIITSKYIAIVLLILWLFVIFSFSNKGITESNDTSYKIVNVVAPIVEKANASKEEKEKVYDVLNYAVRKTAHFTEYAILGILSLNVLRFYKLKKKQIIIYALIFCALYASSDEIHQIFSSGRSPMITDVFIDTAGSILGIFLFKKIYIDKQKSL